MLDIFEVCVFPNIASRFIFILIAILIIPWLEAGVMPWWLWRMASAMFFAPFRYKLVLSNKF